MNTDTQTGINYARIAKAISYLKDNFRTQPPLSDVAAHVNLSEFHFQKMFSAWAGTTPKKFLQYISAEYAKKLLKEKAKTVFDTALATGLSGTSRLHDLFVSIEGMTPAEYRNGGENLRINYDFSESPFGNMLIASTARGICHLSFEEALPEALEKLRLKFPNAEFYAQGDAFQEDALAFFHRDWTKLSAIKLHLKGTRFQLKVWEALLKIPMGSLATYGAVATQVRAPGASRAVGTAIGCNPVAFLIPCHRVIQASGALGGYMWGDVRKAAIIGWEAAHEENGRS